MNSHLTRLKIIINFLIIILCFVTCLNKSYSQEVITPSGGSYKNSTVQLDWTLGEPVIETYISEENILTQGFQQSNLTITAVDPIALDGIKLKVYPNPVPDNLMIENKSGNLKSISLKLFDLTGKLLLKKEVEQNVENLSMQVYRSGNYLLKFYSENDILMQTFKIIKE